MQDPADDRRIPRGRDELRTPSSGDGSAGPHHPGRHADAPDELQPGSRPGASEQEFRDWIALLMAQTRN
jgi:hypothetical protein